MLQYNEQLVKSWILPHYQLVTFNINYSTLECLATLI